MILFILFYLLNLHLPIPFYLLKLTEHEHRIYMSFSVGVTKTVRH